MFWLVIEETGRRHGQLEDWGQLPSPHAGMGADVWFLEAAARQTAMPTPPGGESCGRRKCEIVEVWNCESVEI